jgi:hypothetical protein
MSERIERRCRAPLRVPEHRGPFGENRDLGGLHLLRDREFRRMIILPLGRTLREGGPPDLGETPRISCPMHTGFFETSVQRVVRRIVRFGRRT